MRLVGGFGVGIVQRRDCAGKLGQQGCECGGIEAVLRNLHAETCLVANHSLCWTGIIDAADVDSGHVFVPLGARVC